jgi:hypothetical protein
VEPAETLPSPVPSDPKTVKPANAPTGGIVGSELGNVDNSKVVVSDLSSTMTIITDGRQAQEAMVFVEWTPLLSKIASFNSILDKIAEVSLAA